jgi:protein-tyrosine phosphatase
MSRLLMVCTANICRSPMAQVVTTHAAIQAGLGSGTQVDSAGTRASWLSARPDVRANAALTERGYRVGRLRSRRVATKDFTRFDLILAMDQSNLDDLRRICPPEHVHKLHLFLEFAPELGLREVPDPYYGGANGFEHVLDLCEAAARGLIRQIGSQGGPHSPTPPLANQTL